jgi:ABC-2 type transport system ATP-binding protein
MLVVDQLAARYPRFTLGPISLVLHEGERVALLGRNGAGKSTLLSLMAGQRHAMQGAVRFANADDQLEDRLQLRRDVAYVGAALQAMPWYTVRRHFDFLAHMHPRWNTARAMDLARTLRLDLDAVTGTLSRGNLVKVNLCMAWGQEASVLLLDEPTAGLDPVARADLLHELQLFIDAHPKAAVVYATHLLDELRTINPTRLLVLRDGSLSEFDKAETRGFDVELLTTLMTGLRPVAAVDGAA